MKKKAIEKIPYFGLKKTSRKKDVKYIGVTEVKIIGHEKHLFLEVYRNKKESKEMPLVRIVLTKKDFGTYWPEKEEWTRQKIKPDSCYGRVIWGEGHPTWEQEKKENILQSTEDLERIKKFCKANVYNDPYMGKDFWDDCNLYGMANIHIDAGLIMSETYEEMKGTIFQYSALQEYAKNVREVNPIDYLKRYSQTPQIEVLVKMGLTDVVEKLVKCYYGIVDDENARRPDQFLGIRKERVRQLIRKKGDTHLLGVMQMEKRQGQNWTDEQVEHLAETDLSGTQVEMAQ